MSKRMTLEVAFDYSWMLYLMRERKKLCGREIVAASLLAPLKGSSACKEEGCLGHLDGELELLVATSS